MNSQRSGIDSSANLQEVYDPTTKIVPVLSLNAVTGQSSCEN
jgi:hypothetical protein